jgi:hypothetical protein
VLRRRRDHPVVRRDHIPARLGAPRRPSDRTLECLHAPRNLRVGPECGDGRIEVRGERVGELRAVEEQEAVFRRQDRRDRSAGRRVRDERSDRLAFVRSERGDVLDKIFETAASDAIPGFAVFPAIRTEEQLVDQLKILATGERWTVRRVTVAGLTTDDLLLGLEWKTSGEFISLPMGFGPFVTMPTTRRAPYVCIATWPGGRANPHRKRPKKGIVDFLDSALPKPLSGEEYKAAWDDSVKRAGELLSEQHDDPNCYRDVAFRLSAAAAKRL